MNDRAIIDPRVRVVADFIREHIADPRRLSLVEAARLANISPEHFCRVFRNRTGLSFTEWQCAYRLEHAKRLILDKWMPIALVGVAVGYEHAATFSRVFKRYEGVSPKELRRLATEYPELVDALRTANSRLVFRVGRLAWRKCSALPLLELLAEEFRRGSDPNRPRMRR